MSGLAAVISVKSTESVGDCLHLGSGGMLKSTRITDKKGYGFPVECNPCLSLICLDEGGAYLHRLCVICTDYAPSTRISDKKGFCPELQSNPFLIIIHVDGFRRQSLPSVIFEGMLSDSGSPESKGRIEGKNWGEERIG